MAKYALYDQNDAPMLVDVDSTMVSPFNRGGQPLNMPYVHTQLAKKSIGTDGYDPKRARPGVARHHSDPEKIAAVQKHNRSLMQGNSHYPPLFPEKACNEMLASSHLFCTHRLFKNKCKSDIIGSSFIPNELDNQHIFLLANGAPCYLLKEALPDADARIISDYFSSDQNENKVFDEDFFF